MHARGQIIGIPVPNRWKCALGLGVLLSLLASIIFSPISINIHRPIWLADKHVSKVRKPIGGPLLLLALGKTFAGYPMVCGFRRLDIMCYKKGDDFASGMHRLVEIIKFLQDIPHYIRNSAYSMSPLCGHII